MVAETFPYALRLVLVDEGGLDDDPHDHGGRTAHGIIQREYDGYRARHGLSPQDVWKITPAEYSEIYHDRYWMPWCDRLPVGMDYAFFDACVNAGPAQAAKTLQRALGLRTDGNMGDVTLSTVKQRYEEDPEGVIHAYCESRRAFYRALAQFPRYGRGWLARVDHVEKAAKAMTVHVDHATRNGLPDTLKKQASSRAQAEATKTPPISTEVATGGTVASLMAIIASIKTDLAGFISMPGVESALFGLTLVCAALSVFAWFYKRRVKEAVGG